MTLTDDQVVGVQDLLNRIKEHSSSYLDLIGQPDNSSTTPTGKMGEYISAEVSSGSAVSLTSSTAKNVTSISLTPGDWDVWVNCIFTGNALTTITALYSEISLVSNTEDQSNGRVTFNPFAGTPTLFAILPWTVNVGPCRLSLGTTTTVYMIAVAAFSVSTCSAYGIIQARRRRFYPG